MSDLVATTTALLTAHHHTAPHNLALQPVAQRERNLLWRCRYNLAGVPHSAIAKQLTWPVADRFLTEMAGLRFMTACGVTVAPRLLGGDAVNNVFIMEDLGANASLEGLLNDKHAVDLSAPLAALGRAMAMLHVETMGHEDEFTTIAQQLPRALIQRQYEAAAWRAAAPNSQAWHHALNLAPPTGFETAVDYVATIFVDPGAWLAFTHGDPAPTNNIYHGDNAYLLDFEYGAYRHVLYDLTAWNILCPLPPHLLAPLIATYRAALASQLPECRDDTVFHEQWASLCAYRAFAMLGWIAPDILERNRSWVGDWTAREAILAALHRLAVATESVNSLQPIFTWATSAAGALQKRWPEYGYDPHPAWPALQPGLSEPRQ